ncbi:8789_t:CDS:2 [Funneliformis geosporum]|nr:8789_t:CDS:2 [Funneliformis geosporum]
MVYEFFPSLSQNLSHLLDEADDYNTIITVGENPNTKEFRAHSIILRARSPYFKSALSKNWVSEKNNMINFTKPNISPTVFEMIISESDFLALKNTLDQFISHIRFFEISSIDFHDNVWPFREVLPKKLFESIISFHMANVQPQDMLAPRYSKISVDSNIIKSKHATILTNWIQRKDANARIPIDNKYKFNLIYRGSRDGYDNNTIRSKCSGHGACILVIKIKENETIIGGYNPIGWNFNGHNPNNYSREWRGARGGRGRGSYRVNIRHENYWVKSSESFIFSLGDGKSLKNPKISRVVNSNNAIYESRFNNIALNFGNSDLIINGNAGTCIRQYYDSSILDAIKFNIDEMEMFYQDQTDGWVVAKNDNNDSFCVVSNNDTWIAPQSSWNTSYSSFGLSDALGNANNVLWRGAFASTSNSGLWDAPNPNDSWDNPPNANNSSWGDESNDDSWGADHSN